MTPQAEAIPQNLDVKEVAALVKEQSEVVDRITESIGRVIVGQHEMVERLLVGLLCRAHVLLEGVPGLAKTTAVRALASSFDASFQRLQFTPDLLPADLIGTLIYNQKENTFEPKKGPVFANFILADEINRAPAKVQSALLEAMQERQVTIGEDTYKLPSPFLVLATQNPIDQEGTYPLPEAQIDRFMLKLKISYPSKSEERRILDLITSPGTNNGDPDSVEKISSAAEIDRLADLTKHIYIANEVKDYIVDLVAATRNPEEYSKDLGGLIQYGASPRATIFLAQAAKAHAFLRHRGHVTPDDVKRIGMDVLRHRVVLTYEAEAENLEPEDLIQRIFDTVKVP
jgi:MoxR-like ATPase